MAAISKGIEPDTIFMIDDSGFKASDYTDYGIVNNDSSEHLFNRG